MNAALLSFGDIVRYHKTVLRFVGIKKATGSTNPEEYEAIYNGAYAVQALVNDESIEPVEITPEFLENNGFEAFNGLNERPCWLHKQAGLILRKDRVVHRLFEMEVDVAEVGIQGDIRYIHELQAVLRMIGSVDTALHLDV